MMGKLKERKCGHMMMTNDDSYVIDVADGVEWRLRTTRKSITTFTPCVKIFEMNPLKEFSPRKKTFVLLEQSERADPSVDGGFIQLSLE